ncbi:MAG: hypothetical protein AAGF25_08405, partial [Pseudomonadota bacterium]
GLFATRSFLTNFSPGLDRRAEAHNSSSISDQLDNGFGKYESVGQYLTAVWQLQGPEKEYLGELRLFGTGTAVWGGNGELDLDQQPTISVSLSDEGRNEERVTFSVSRVETSTLEKPVGELIVFLPPMPRNEIVGQLILDGVENRVVLQRLGSYEGEYEGDSIELEIEETTFALRNVPSGRTLVVRLSPNRSSQPIGQLSTTANDLRILSCDPSIDRDRYKAASFEGKLELLGGAWCQINSVQAGVQNGFILGRYLLPKTQ